MKANTGFDWRVWIGITSLFVLFAVHAGACGTPIAPKEVCVMWAHALPDGGIEPIADAGKE